MGLGCRVDGVEGGRGVVWCRFDLMTPNEVRAGDLSNILLKFSSRLSN